MADASSETSLIDLAKAGTFEPPGIDPDVKPNRARKSAPPPKKRPALPPWKDGVISHWATNLYQTAGQMVVPFEPNYGAILQGISEPAGQAWENLARDSPGLRRVFHSLMTTTKMSELIMAHMPLIILVLHKHGPVQEQMSRFAEKLSEESTSV